MGEVSIWNYNELKENYTPCSGIPKLMMRTYTEELQDLPKYLRKLIEKTGRNNPEYQQVYFSSRDVEEFIQEFFPDYIDDYKVLVPGAYQADLFRILFLYKYGGIYNDITMKYLIPLSEIDDGRMVLVSDRYVNKWGLYNAFIISPPGNELISLYISKIIERIRSRSYAINCLDITGPGCFWDAFTEYFNLPPDFCIRELDEHGGIKLYHYDGAYVAKGDKRIIRTKTGKQHAKMYSAKPYYHELWLRREVYK